MRPHGMVKRLLVLCFVILLGVLCAACARQDTAQGPDALTAAQEQHISVPARTPAPPAPQYADIRVYFDGLLADKGYYDSETFYLSTEAICSYFDLELSLELQGDSFSLKGDSLDLSGTLGQGYMIANYRYLYTPTDYLVINGDVYLPSHIVEKVFGLSAEISNDPFMVNFKMTEYKFIEGGRDYYETHFASEDMFWLSRIIHSEAYQQPLAGLIGVGNVVLNRVASDIYPDSIFSVVFDIEHNVQFDPVATGGVYDDPDYMSEVAAYLCLEGYNTVGDCMYFVNPERGDNTWFEKALTFVTSIGGHDFYT